MVEHEARRPWALKGESGGCVAVRGTGPAAEPIQSGRITGSGGRLLPLVRLTLVSSLALGGLVSCGGDEARDPGEGGRPGASAAQGQRGGPSRNAPSGPASPDGPSEQPRGEGVGPEAHTKPGEDPASADARIELGREVEPWLVAALTKLAGAGALDLDLPVAMHLPVLASPRSDFITPRQLIEHTAHLGARAYEDFLRANPGSDALKVQAFLVALGADDAPGSRPVWRRAHLDLMGWLVQALTGTSDLAAGLNAAFDGEDAPAARLVESVDGDKAPLTPVRGRVSVLRAAHERIVERFPVAMNSEGRR